MITFVIISRLINYALLVLQLLMIEDCGIIRVSKIKFFSTVLVLKGLNKIEKLENHLKPPKLVSQSLFRQFHMTM